MSLYVPSSSLGKVCCFQLLNNILFRHICTTRFPGICKQYVDDNNISQEKMRRQKGRVLIQALGCVNSTKVIFRVHFFGKIQDWIFELDYKYSFLRKRRKSQKRIFPVIFLTPHALRASITRQIKNGGKLAFASVFQ